MQERVAREIRRLCSMWHSGDGITKLLFVQAGGKAGYRQEDSFRLLRQHSTPPRFCCANLAASPSNTAEELDMADPKDLREAADAIHGVRALPAVQRHRELDEPLRQAEEWARREHGKVSERKGIAAPDLADKNRDNR